MKKHGITLLTVLFALVVFLSANCILTTQAATVNDLTYRITYGKVTITGCNSDASGKLIIPNTINGYPVTSIGERAFSGCSGLTSVTIPDRVTSIGIYAFYNCTSLTSVTIPDRVTSIGSYAFSNCTSLTSVIIGDSVTSIGAGVFSSCSSLPSVTIPDSVTSIGDRVFSGCSGLTSVTIPDGVTSIGEGAFSACSGLTSVTIPDGVTSIGEGAFSACSSLTSVTIPDSVTSIGGLAFFFCTSLTSVTIPDGVTSIGAATFASCSSLTSVTISDSVTSISEVAFYDCSSLTDVYYTGTQAQWDSIFIGSDNGELLNARLYTNYKPLSIIAQPTSKYAKIGTIAWFTVKASGTGLQYQWQYRTSANGSWKAASATGCKTANLTVPVTAAQSGCQYRCIITDSTGKQVISEAATLQTEFMVTTQPVSQYWPAGKTAKFTVKATGIGLQYQWQYRTSAWGSWENVTGTGNKTATLSVAATAARNGYQYRCKITDQYGSVIYSEAATLKIVTLKITTQPANKYLPAGKTAKFTVKVSGTGLKYQWQYRTSSRGSWKTASGTGSKKATFSVSATAACNGYQYRCKITDQYGSVIYSKAATLKIVTLKITTQPSSVTLAKGKTATFKVVAKGTNLKYQWQYRKNAKGAWKKATNTGNKTATLKVPVTAARNGYQYRCVITDKYGNVMNSKAATLKVK